MTIALTSGNPFKIILLFTLPLMLGNLFQQFYSLADTIIVGRFVGVNALAAVGATGSVNYLILGFVIGMCNGFAIPIAQLFGAHDDSDLRRHVANATWLCIAWGVVLTVVTVALTRPIMELMQTPADIIDGASAYIGWLFAGRPVVLHYKSGSAAITAAGKPQNLLSCALESIGTAMATYAGQNLGAARLDRVRSGVKSSYIMVVAYSVLAFIALHFGDVVIIGLFLDTKTEVEIVAMARDYMFWNSLFFIPLGALIVWRYNIQGLGYYTLAMMAGVAEMVARTVIGLVLIPVLGYFGAELSNPVAWVAACLFLSPAFLWTVKHLEDRLLAGHLAMQHSAVGD